MTSYDFDLVVIGAGPAGEKGAVQAAYFKKRVAIIECEPTPGGAAVHTGTLPSKTLRETALFLSGYRQNELYGVSVHVDKGVAAPKLLSRKDAVVSSEVERFQWNLDRHGVKTIRGMGKLVDAHTIEVQLAPGDREANGGKESLRITSEFVLISTGSKPHHPPNMPFDDPQIDDSDEILKMDRLPETMTVLGGGVIGCEYATMFAAMGVRVTLVEGRDRLLPFLDLEMGERLSESMRGLGIEILLREKPTGAKRDGENIVTTMESGKQLTAERLLVASGRSGRTDGMGLTEIGVELDKRGYVVVDADYKTKVPSVYAAGDVIGFPALASTSMEQARVAVCHAFGFAYKRAVSTLLPFGIYTIPEVSCVGLSEEDCEKKKLDYVVGRALYRDNARGKIIGDKDGVIKLVFERATKKLVGCHIIGDRASELVHVGQAIIALDGTVDTLIEMVFNYPTLGETFKYAAYDALGTMAARDKEARENKTPTLR
jgi:NAD(P) transhydrogenase